ncbi:MAG: hypothetical protein R2749_10920 [Acidimicrobiales bacterium]
MRCRSTPVLYEQDGHVVTITYNRPERLNAINGAMRVALSRPGSGSWATPRLGGHPHRRRAGVLRGGRCEGRGRVEPGVFPDAFWEKPTINSFESGLELFKPTIAAVSGPCLGYAVTTVSFCDFDVLLRSGPRSASRR